MALRETNSRSENKGWNPQLEPLMKFLTGRRKGIRTGQAKEVGKRAIDYFRGKDFVTWVQEHRAECKRLAPTVLSHLPDEAVNPARDAADIANLLMSNGFIYRAHWQPPKLANSEAATKRPKWPSKLSMSHSQTFEEKTSFYVIVYEGDKTWRYIFLGALILAVLTVVMWPAWPAPAKLAIWSVFLVLALSIWVLIAVRLVVFVLFWFFGVDFWIMPNLLNDDIGIIEAFLPLYSWNHRGDDWYMVGARIACAIFSAIAVYQLGQTHSASDIYGFANRSFLDVYEWGQNKISDEPADPRSSIPSVEDFEKEELDEVSHKEDSAEETNMDTLLTEKNFDCLKGCGFMDLAEFDERCKDNCVCLRKLFDEQCLDSCSKELRRRLGDDRDEACESEEAN